MPTVAVLGAGIMGSCLALYLARKGFDVSLFDMADAPLQGASRWNEGKIHLGYLYSGDPTLRTAKRLLPGGLAFASLIEDLTGSRLSAVTHEGDHYLVHRNSVADADAMAAYFGAVTALAREHADAGSYLVDLRHAEAHRLSRSELEAISPSGHIVAGFRVPERSVSTVAVAGKLSDALSAEARIRLRMGNLVARVEAIDGIDGRWRVDGEAFDWAINALWHGRVAVDVAAGLTPIPGWSHRYRVSAFVRTKEVIDAPSAVLAVGAFGDMKNYGGRDFYLSWYPAGLLAQGTAIEPPALPAMDEAARSAVSQAIAEGLGPFFPQARQILEKAQSVSIEGGYVFAQGQGDLNDRLSTLHRRDLFGVRRLGRYVSIDTGKYSTAPLMARELANEIAAA